MICVQEHGIRSRTTNINDFRFFIFLSLLGHSYSDESPLIPNEFLNEPHITSHNLGGDPILGVMIENEPDQWSSSVPSSVVRSLKEKQVNQVKIEPPFR